MMTARQQKFYVRIGLLSTATDISEIERENLARAKKWLDRGDDFRIVYDTLGRGFNALKEDRLQGKLTPVVNKLFEDLKVEYGEPVEEKKYSSANFSIISPFN